MPAAIAAAMGAGRGQVRRSFSTQLHLRAELCALQRRRIDGMISDVSISGFKRVKVRKIRGARCIRSKVIITVGAFNMVRFFEGLSEARSRLYRRRFLQVNV